MKKFLLSLALPGLFSFGVSAAVGDTFTIDGLLYTVLTENPNTVSVKAPEYSFDISGDLVIPASVTNNDTEYTVTTLPTNAIGYCLNLTTVALPASITTIINGPFYRCHNLTEILVDEANPNFVSVDGVLYNKDMTKLVSCPEGKTGDFIIPQSVTELQVSALNGCSNLTSITLPDGLKTIGSNALYLCSGISSISITANVASASTAFLGRCNSLQEIIVEHGNENYKVVDNMLYNSDMTTLLMAPVGSNTLIDINELPESVTSILSFAYSGSKALTNVYIPARINTIGIGAFIYTPNLINFDVDENHASYCSVDGVLFNKAKTQVIAYPYGRTDTYVVPDGVTTLTANSFRGANLTGLVIPASVTTAATTFIQDANNLKKIVDLNPVPQTISVTAMLYKPEDLVVYVPQGSKEAYEQAWPLFHNFEEIGTFLMVLSENEKTLTAGEDLQLKAYFVDPGGDLELDKETWSSSDPNVATVDENTGLVTAVAPGKCVITVTGTDHGGTQQTDQCDITVASTSAVTMIESDDVKAIDWSKPFEVFDLSGKKVGTKIENLAPAIYIVRQDSASAKIAVK